MIKFRSEISIPPFSRPIEHSQSILTIGSCFADNMAAMLKQYRFNVLVNPFSVLYNPASIYEALRLLAESRLFTADDLIFHEGEWHSFYHHSEFSHSDQQVCLQRINEQLSAGRQFLKEAGHLIITYGSAFVFEWIETGKIVSNCHKIPAGQFSQRLLSLEEIIRYLREAITLAKQVNPDLNIILSVSPIRYLKNSFAENQLSKSLLIVATHRVMEMLNEKQAGGQVESCSYFPAYEIMLDDLRDYRFYEANLTHPNQQAIDYIWEKFSRACLSVECQKILPEMEKLNRARQHRPRNPHSQMHQQFIRQQLSVLDQLKSKYPYLNLKNDYEYFSSQLAINR